MVGWFVWLVALSGLLSAWLVGVFGWLCCWLVCLVGLLSAWMVGLFVLFFGGERWKGNCCGVICAGGGRVWLVYLVG